MVGIGSVMVKTTVVTVVAVMAAVTVVAAMCRRGRPGVVRTMRVSGEPQWSGWDIDVVSRRIFW